MRKVWSRLVVHLAACVAALALPVEGLASQLIWTQWNSIWYSELDGSGMQQLISGVQPAYDLRVDDVNGKLYWGDTPYSPGRIMRANLDGSQVETVYTSQPGSEVLNFALDTANQQIYIAQPSLNTVSRVGTDGTGYTQLIYSPNANGMEIDPLAGHIYWTERFGNYIRRANLDGTGVQTIFATSWHPGAVDAWTIDLDPAAGKMYFAGYIPSDGSYHIQVANLDGTGFQELLALNGAPWALRLDPTRSKLYWAENKSIYRANVDGTGLELVLTAPGPIRGIAFGTVPEPATIGLLIAGGLALARRRS